jgi:hypothetical protein
MAQQVRRVPRVLWGLLDRLVLREPKGFRARQELRDRRVLRVAPARPEPTGLPGHEEPQEHEAPEDQQGHQESKDNEAHKGQRDQQGPPEQPVQRAPLG